MRMKDQASVYIASGGITMLNMVTFKELHNGVYVNEITEYIDEHILYPKDTLPTTMVQFNPHGKWMIRVKRRAIGFLSIDEHNRIHDVDISINALSGPDAVLSTLAINAESIFSHLLTTFIDLDK